MSEVVVNFWNEEASRWSLQNKNPLVGWYDNHMTDMTEGPNLFRDVPVKVGGLALEYGCGPGRNIIKYRAGFRQIDGADISADILKKLPDNLTEANVPVPALYHTDGHSLTNVPSNTYDVVFSVICQQHIGCRSWRLEIYREVLRVLKPGGYFTFQMGFGPGHSKSVDYFHDYDETDTCHRDTRVENVNDLQKDIEDQGLVNFDHHFSINPLDVHPQWIWVRCQKPM
jgi:SAM-dependent methyltransferase